MQYPLQPRMEFRSRPALYADAIQNGGKKRATYLTVGRICSANHTCEPMNRASRIRQTTGITDPQPYLSTRAARLFSASRARPERNRTPTQSVRHRV
jgi:hypothetical protein